MSSYLSFRLDTFDTVITGDDTWCFKHNKTSEHAMPRLQIKTMLICCLIKVTSEVILLSGRADKAGRCC